jgi:hypothetical protein
MRSLGVTANGFKKLLNAFVTLFFAESRARGRRDYLRALAGSRDFSFEGEARGLEVPLLANCCLPRPAETGQKRSVIPTCNIQPV